MWTLALNEQFMLRTYYFLRLRFQLLLILLEWCDRKKCKQMNLWFILVSFPFPISVKSEKNMTLDQRWFISSIPKMKPTRKIKNNVVPRYNGSLFKNFLALKFAFEGVTSPDMEKYHTHRYHLYIVWTLNLREKLLYVPQGDFPN